MRPKTLLCTITALLLHGAAAADSIPEPNTRDLSLDEFTSTDILQWKLLGSIYVSALEKEAERLAEEIASLLQEAPVASSAFLEAHNAFLEFARTQAEYSESVIWVDLSTGETSWGSGCGDMEISVLGSLYWKRILYYRNVLDSIENGGFTDAVFPVLPDSSIGGY